MITSHRPQLHPHINPMPLIALGVVLIVVFGVITLMPAPSTNNIDQVREYKSPAFAGDAFPVYRQSERTHVYPVTGAYTHIGDCGFDRYDLPESGAAGYCYVEPPVGDLPLGGSHRQPAEDKNTQTQSLDQPDVSTPGSTDVIDDQPTGGNDTPPETPPGIPPETPPEIPPEAPPDNPPETPKHCNKGGGNGEEGCDPGNHPEKGQDDEP